MTATPLRRAIIRTIRRAGLLRLADSARYRVRSIEASASNRRFRREHPGFEVPPEDLVFDALNYVAWDTYRDQGRRHAAVFARLILEASQSPVLEVLEWGCGPGRLIRHMPELLAPRDARVTGSDYNERSIAWCSAHLQGIEFVTNGLVPPLSLAPNRFDAVYSFSVFTHLSEQVQLAWAADLARVLRPGGTLICTTHGESYRKLLATRDEQLRFERGEVVVQDRYAEGKKWFLAVHPERWVRESLLRGYEHVELRPQREEPDLSQDIWLARKPA